MVSLVEGKCEVEFYVKYKTLRYHRCYEDGDEVA